jgi:hypothetical protein
MALDDINKLLFKSPHHAAALLLKIKILSGAGNYD